MLLIIIRSVSILEISANKIVTYFFSALLLIMAGIAAYEQQPWLLLVPFGLLVCLYLLQNLTLLFYVLIAAIPWSVEYSFKSLGTDLPDEPLMLLTAFAVLMWMVYNRKQIRQKGNLHPLLLLMLIQLAWTMITVMVSTNVVHSTKYLLAKGWYLLAFLGAPLILFRDIKVFRRSAVILLVSMMVAMFVAIVRHSLYGMTFERVNDALSPFFRNHVTYSSLLVCMVPVIIAYIQVTAIKKWRICLRILLVVTIVALYFSYARGSWLALFTGLLVYWLLRKRLLVLSFILFFAFCIGAVFWLKSNDNYLRYANDYKTTIFHTNFEEHLIATYKLKDVSTAERFYRWVAGVRMVNDSWRTGFGPTTFYDHYKSYAIPAFRTWVSNNEEHSTVHNYYLLTIIEQGALGLLLLLVLMGTMFWYAQKIYHRTADRFWKTVIAATVSILMMVCTVNFLSDMIETDKVGSIFYLCLATIIIADVKTREASSHELRAASF